MMKVTPMTGEPASSAAAGAVGWKLLGGAAGIGAGLAAIVAMAMMTPRSPREWAVGLISTVVGSIGGGSVVIQHFGLTSWMTHYLGALSVLGIVFACGLPAWALVRALFTYLERRKDKDLSELAAELRRQLKDS